MTNRFVRRPGARTDFALSRRSALKGVASTGVLMLTSSWRISDALAATALPDIKGRDPTTLVVAVDATVDNLDPATNLEWAYGLQPVYDTLLTLKEGTTTETAPGLALEALSSDDASIWTLKLRGEVRFHDGTACDADAVKRSIVRLISLPIGAGYIWNIEDPGKQIVVVDPLTLKFEMGEPRPLFALELAGQYTYWIASPHAAETNSKGEDDLGNGYLREHPVGTGPFVFESLDPGVEYIVKQNPDYWGGSDPKRFKRIISKTIPVGGTQRQLLEEGAIDIMFGARAEMVRELGQDSRFVVTDQPTLTMQYIALGAYGPLADPRARLAMNHAFDSAAYVRDVELGNHTPPTSVFPSLLETADSSVGVLEFDLRKARELFDAAGVAPGTELTLAYYTEFGNLAGELLQAWLGEIGIKLALQEKSYSGFISDYFSDAPPESRPNMYYFSWWPNISHPHSFASQLFYSQSAGSLGGNAGFYRNEEADKLIDAMYQVPLGDPALLETSRRLQRLVTREDPAWIPVLEERTHLTYRKDIEGLKLNPLQVLTLDMKALSRQA